MLEGSSVRFWQAIHDRRVDFGHLRLPCGGRVAGIGRRSNEIIYRDVERAEAFFGAVLGWTFTPGSDQRGRQVTGVAPHHGLWGGHDRSTLFLCYVVDDVDEATRRRITLGAFEELFPHVPRAPGG